MTVEKPHVFVRCDDGTVMKHDLPLPGGIRSRVDKKELLLVNEDGTPLAEPEAEAPAGNSDEVPAGSIAVVLGWIGEDKMRAQRALDVEAVKDQPRKSLVAALEEMLTTP